MLLARVVADSILGAHLLPDLMGHTAHSLTELVVADLWHTAHSLTELVVADLILAHAHLLI